MCRPATALEKGGGGFLKPADTITKGMTTPGNSRGLSGRPKGRSPRLVNTRVTIQGKNLHAHRIGNRRAPGDTLHMVALAFDCSEVKEHVSGFRYVLHKYF